MILLDQRSRIVIQGITGTEGSFHTREAIKFGTKILAGVVPGKSGTELDGIPIYDRVIDAVEQHGVNTSGIFVPARFAADAILEAIDAGIQLIVCLTEGIPVMDMIKVKQALRNSDSRLIGPNTPGITTPGVGKIGFMPNFIHSKGEIGVVSRSGTLTYEVIYELTRHGMGQSTSLGIGGDQIVGLDFVDVLELFEQDPQTKAVVLIGEIGGSAEEEAAEFIKQQMSKPLVAFVAGKSAPPGRRMGHAGAIISGGAGTAQRKIQALKEAGAIVVESPYQIASKLEEIL